MAYQRAFCFSNEFNELLINNSNEILEKILNDFCDVYLDLDEEEILNLIEENPIFKSFTKRDNGLIIAAKEDFENIKKSNFIPFLNDILVLNESFKTEEIRGDFGILAVKPEEIEYLESLDLQFGYSFNDNLENNFKNWLDLFQNPIKPLNSAILIDNFLWSKLENFNEDNTENLYVIFQHLIPQKLKIPFHLSLIISNKDSRLTPKIAQEKINKVAGNLSKLTGKKIEISITTQTDTKTFHERVILTNFHCIYSHKGFTLFKNKKLIDYSSGDRNWVYKDIRKYHGQIRKHHHNDLKQNINKLITSNYKNPTNVIFNIGNTNNPLLN